MKAPSRSLQIHLANSPSKQIVSSHLFRPLRARSLYLDWRYSRWTSVGTMWFKRLSRELDDPKLAFYLHCLIKPHFLVGHQLVSNKSLDQTVGLLRANSWPLEHVERHIWSCYRHPIHKYSNWLTKKRLVRFKGRFPENNFLGFKEAVQAVATIIETGEKKSKQKKRILLPEC